MLVDFKLVFSFDFSGTVTLNYDSYLISRRVLSDPGHRDGAIALFIFALILMVLSCVNVRRFVIATDQNGDDKKQEDENGAGGLQINAVDELAAPGQRRKKKSARLTSEEKEDAEEIEESRFKEK